MIGFLNLGLRLAIWFLLTADGSPANIAIGIVVSLLIPGRSRVTIVLQDWLRVLGEILIAIPQAYLEAIQIMVQPHRGEAIDQERIKPRRTPGLIFLDIFLITFTPKTIVLNYHEAGWYDVHRVRRLRGGK